MVNPQWPSPFIEPVAVEAWDAWVRWREGAHVHDVSIEDTWQRVAGALAMAEPPLAQARWRARFLEQLARWQVLPDIRLLAAAGTGSVAWTGDNLHATLNASVFVHAGSSPRAQIDFAAVAAGAGIAVRMLDNAALLTGSAPTRLQVGLAGVADAAALLGLAYDSDDARSQAGLLARALAAGCVEASLRLAHERGAHVPGVSTGLASLRAATPEVLHGVRRRGLRHAALTATTSQRRVALLANDVADALDPLQEADHRYTLAAPGDTRAVNSSGYARRMLRNQGAAEHLRQPPASRLWQAQVALRAAVQPWMDSPIDYPLVLAREPSREDTEAMPREAAMRGLRVPGWRSTALPP